MTTYGPFTRTDIIPGLVKTTRTWYRQKPITGAPLAFTVQKYVRKGWTGEEDSASYQSWSYPDPISDPALVPLRNSIFQKAYGRLMNEVSGASAQLGADLAERKQTIDTIVRHATTLTRAARALKKGYVLDFFKILGIRKRSWRTAASDMGGVWLEYSFGWKPLVEDIYAAVNVVQRPIMSKVVRGRANGNLSATQTTLVPGTSLTVITHKWVLRHLLSTTISVDNWWAWKANELGLTNPASIAWEVVPFSFVVDWFLPIGNWLQSLTDFVGLSRKDSFNTWYTTLDRVDTYTNFLYPSRNHWRADRRVNLVRGLSLPSPPKLSSRFTGFYSARGANAIALLSSTLKDLPATRVPSSRRFKMSRDMYNWERNLY